MGLDLVKETVHLSNGLLQKGVYTLTIASVFLTLFLGVGLVARAATPSPAAGQKIVLSEVFACKLTEGAEEYKIQWIEFYNSTSDAVDLSGWKIVKNTSSNNTKILSGIIQPTSYFRVPIGSTSTGFLNQTGFGFTLVEIGSPDFGWETFPGDYKNDTTKIEKCTSSIPLMSWIKEGQAWFITTSPTASQSNTLTALATPTPSPTATPTASPSPSPTPTATPTPTPSPTVGPTPTITPGQQPTTISLSEFYACQADGTKEWVELFNSATASVTLSGWKLMDDDGNDQPISTISIAAKGYSVIEITKYARGMLTNDGDVVNLFDGNGKKVDSYAYSACQSEYTWAKIAGGWKETMTVTRGVANPTTGSATPVVSASATLEGDGEESGSVLGTQAAQDSEPKSETPLPTPKTAGGNGTVVLAIGSILIGVSMLVGIGGYLAWDPYLKKKIYPLLHRN